MILLLVLLVPLAIYLITLGFINRRSHPLLISGDLDCVGVLFAASGFLLLGGPALLSSPNERWRRFWLLGSTRGSLLAAGEDWSQWALLASLYFVGVVSLAGWMFWRARRVTAIYNIDPALLDQTLEEVAEHLGLRLLRTGNAYVLGVPSPSRRSASLVPQQTETGEDISESVGTLASLSAPGPNPSSPLTPWKEKASEEASLEESAYLEVDPFPLFQHVTLRWAPTRSPVRQQVEMSLRTQLATMPAPDNEAGAWLQILGLGLLSFSSIGCLTLVILQQILGG